MSSLLNDLNDIVAKTEPNFNMDSLLRLRNVYLSLIAESLDKKDLGVPEESMVSKIAKMLNVTDKEKNIAYKILKTIYSCALKQRLPYDDRVIEKILYYVIVNGGVSEIYVDYDRIIFEIITKDNRKEYIEEPLTKIIDITSKEFYRGGNDYLLNFLVQSINNSIGAIFSGETRLIELLKINNGRIEYTIPNLKMETNYSLNEILASEEIDDKTKNKVNLRVRYGNNIYYFELKIRGKYITLTQYYNEPDCLSEKLGTGTQK